MTSTVDGTVLDVPVKEGSSVIEANNFNEGTTIAVVADMKDLIFQGRVDESEVGKLAARHARHDRRSAHSAATRLMGKLEYISPKGKEKDGTHGIRGPRLRRDQARGRAARQLQRERRHHPRDATKGARHRRRRRHFEQGQPFVDVELEPNRSSAAA